MKLLGLFLTLIAVAASAAELASSPPPQAQPVAQAVAQAPARAAVVVVETRAAEPRLPVRELPTQPWLLLLAGAAFAGWMAHRRLSYF